VRLQFFFSSRQTCALNSLGGRSVKKPLACSPGTCKMRTSVGFGNRPEEQCQDKATAPLLTRTCDISGGQLPITVSTDMQQVRSGVNLWSGNELVPFYEGRCYRSIYICSRHSSACSAACSSACSSLLPALLPVGCDIDRAMMMVALICLLPRYMDLTG
jgi:hypothetical protein